MKILNRTSKNFCVDKSRVYATGFSNGGLMAYEIALRKSNVFAAVASVEGSVMKGYYKTLNGTSPPIALMDIHGTQDTTIPSNQSVSDDYWKYETT